MQDRNYYLYCITNIKTNKIYIGVHKTENLYDGYMGSGIALKISIKKYGLCNFKKDIIQFFGSEEEMYKAEKEIVNEEFVNSKLTYNMKLGGHGGYPKNNTAGNKNGFYGKTHSAEARLKIKAKARQKRSPHAKTNSSKMLGSNNPMFGKRPSNAKNVTIDGVMFTSIKAAAAALNINYTTLKGRIKRGYYQCQV